MPCEILSAHSSLVIAAQKVKFSLLMVVFDLGLIVGAAIEWAFGHIF